jgi:hypothetical protein
MPTSCKPEKGSRFHLKGRQELIQAVIAMPDCKDFHCQITPELRKFAFHPNEVLLILLDFRRVQG